MKLQKVTKTARLFSNQTRYFETHSVFNQSTQLGCTDLNLYRADPSLTNAINGFCPSLSTDCKNRLSRFGAQCGSKELNEIADLAEKHHPTLRQFDIYGRRIDVVDYHRSYHQLMQHGIENGSVAYGFVNAGHENHSHTARAAMIYMENKLEPGQKYTLLILRSFLVHKSMFIQCYL